MSDRTFSRRRFIQGAAGLALLPLAPFAKASPAREAAPDISTGVGAARALARGYQVTHVEFESGGDGRETSAEIYNGDVCMRHLLITAGTMRTMLIDTIPGPFTRTVVRGNGYLCVTTLSITPEGRALQRREVRAGAGYHAVSDEVLALN